MHYPFFSKIGCLVRVMSTDILVLMRFNHKAINKSMKKSVFFEKSQFNGVEDLTLNECVEYNGGETLWYWVLYGIGRGANAIGKAAKYVFDKNVEVIVENGGLPHAY